MAALCACALALPSPAAGEAAQRQVEAALEDCLAAAAHPAICIGAGAFACMGGDGAAPLVAGPCYGRENAYWEIRIDEALVRLLPSAAAAEGFADRVDWPDPRPGLLAVIEQFDAYRDAVCDMEVAYWGGGSAAGPAWIACRMEVSAQHALRLEAWEALQ